MRKIDFHKDQEFYNEQHKAPGKYTEDLLDLYRFNLLLKLYGVIDEKTSLFRGKSVLNVAAGYGREAYLILNEEPKTLSLCDYSFSQIKQAANYLVKFKTKSLLCADSESLPFKDKSFDVCYIKEALHHFISPQKAIDEFIRVTKDIIAIDEPAGGFFRRILNRFFVFFGIQGKYERGYLEAFRVNKQIFSKLVFKYKFDMIFHSYFIYYFAWYKNSKSRYLKLTYRRFLSVLNFFLHVFGNRSIVILDLRKRSLSKSCFVENTR